LVSRFAALSDRLRGPQSGGEEEGMNKRED
jgi:hypothetical protein